MTQRSRTHRRRAAGVGVLAALLAAVALAPSASAAPRQIPYPSGNGAPALPGAVVALPDAEAQTMRLLKTTPDVATVGTPVVFSSSGLPADTPVDVIWETANVNYLLDTPGHGVEWWGRGMTKVHLRITSGRTDAQGNLEIKSAVPADYGSLHDIYLVANGRRVAKGGMLVARGYEMSPKSGPVGSEITLRVTGLGAAPYPSTVALMWDNAYMGAVTGTTTRGQATFKIRAAGPVGKHVVELAPSSSAHPFLNVEQSALSFIGTKRLVFTTTHDPRTATSSVARPAKVTLPASERQRLQATTTAGVSASLSSQVGTVLSKVTLKAGGLKPGPAQLIWMTARGTRTGAGFEPASVPFATATVPANGTLETSVQIPDDLGGWHSIDVAQGGTVVASVPYYVEYSLVSVTPKKVKAGQMVTVHLKGGGWTEIDNILAVTYNNMYVGYVCSFFSAGDVKLKLMARGKPGTQLIDLWPSIYKSRGDDLWDGRWPFLTFERDYPGIALGFRVPNIRASFEIVK